MVKKLFLSLTSGFSLFTMVVNAGEIPHIPRNVAVTAPFFGDSTIKKDSTTTAAVPGITNDPKAAFRELLASSSLNADADFQLNPKVVSFVEDYLQDHGDELEKMKTWGRPYFDMMDEIFIQHGLPVELKYLSVIESALKSRAVSWAGAVGPWQFMAATARTFGLRVNKHADDRLDYYKSTHAAARYLTELYGIYNDWLLVIAAYNCGPGGVNAAIRKSGSRNFWDLQYFLPAESRKHVKKFIATHYIMEGQAGLTTTGAQDLKNINFTAGIVTPEKNLIAKIQDLPDTRKITISGKYNSNVISKQVAYEISDFNKLNPDFDNKIAVNGNYDLRLPNEKMDLFLANKYQILNESMQLLLNAANKTASNTPAFKQASALK